MHYARAFKWVRYRDIDQHLQSGWFGVIPRDIIHHHAYAVEMLWLCDCKIPARPKEITDASDDVDGLRSPA